MFDTLISPLNLSVRAFARPPTRPSAAELLVPRQMSIARLLGLRRLPVRTTRSTETMGGVLGVWGGVWGGSAVHAQAEHMIC